MQAMLQKYFGLEDAQLQSMVGYDSKNWRVTEGKGNRFVLKRFELSEVGFIEAENEVLLRLNEALPGHFPNPLPNHDGQLLTAIVEKDPASEEIPNGQQRNHEPGLYRLQTYLEGTPLAEADHTPEMFYSFGDLLGQLTQTLSDHHHPEISARRIFWDLTQFYPNKRYKDYISTPSDRKLVEHFYLQYEVKVLPYLSQLRRQVIHGDANDWNVFVQEGQVSGIIDFGDMTESPVIHEVAIALAYALSNKKDPLAAAVPFLQAFHKHFPLEAKEVELLYYFIAARLCVTVSACAYSRIQDPENAYRTVSEDNAWDLLRKWVATNPVHAERVFKEGIGMEIAAPYSHENREEDLKKRNQHLSRALSISFTEPIKMESAAFQYMFDATGRTYLDAYNNIPHVGHSHPRVVEAGRKQMAQLNTNTRYLYDSLNEYAARLTALFPEKLNKVFFVNSGSAASDLAIRLARQHTGLKGIMVMEHGYHGHTRQGIEVSHYKFAGKGGSGAAGDILVAPIPNMYRSGFSVEDPYAGKKFAQKAIDMMVMEGRPPAAFLTEPVVGCGGQVPLAPGYLKEMYRFIRDQGGVCISDEVQTGFGRLGEVFWGYELQEVVPDIVVVGKPICNGHPMGAVICTAEIAASFENGMEFFSSFGGNPVSCAMALAVLDVIEEEGLQAHANEVGGYLKGKLIGLMGAENGAQYIGDVRGHGLFLGVELVKDRETKEPYPELAKEIKERLKAEFGIMIGTDGPDNNVLKIKPPMCFSRENADQLVQGIRAILENPV